MTLGELSKETAPSEEIVWTEEARRRVEKAPVFVRPGIYKLMIKRARERGRPVITSEFLTEIRNESMLRVAKCIKGFGFEELAAGAFEVAGEKMRKLPQKVEVIEQIEAFLRERTEKNTMIIGRFKHYLERVPERGLPWTDEAIARIQRLPSFLLEMIKGAAEEEAGRRKEHVVTPEVVEEILRRIPMEPFSLSSPPPSRGRGEVGVRIEGPLPFTMPWTAEAEERIRRIPIPPVRSMIIHRVEAWAQSEGLEVVDLSAYEAGRG